ncbi:hypothetical protein BLOT_016522 [Blomia tropicalis]|nr:hypothetical protein BLOT_016522 [Blomia tropicalis]
MNESSQSWILLPRIQFTIGDDRKKPDPIGESNRGNNFNSRLSFTNSTVTQHQHQQQQQRRGRSKF